MPDGEPPEEIRKKWIGNEMPVHAVHDDRGRGVITGRKSNKGILYNVDQAVALDILSLKHPEATQWWHEHGFPKAGKNFAFRQEEVVVVGELEELPKEIRMFPGLLEVGVGGQDCL